MGTILILMQKENDKALLRDCIGRRYKLLTTPPEKLNSSVDLCIVDGPSFKKYKSLLAEEKSFPKQFFLPVLLVTAKKGVRLITASVWKIVDDIITTPIEKKELQARVEVLLRARRLSVELVKSKEYKIEKIRKELLQKNILQELIISLLPVAVIGVDPSGVILSWNPTAETIFGWSEKDVAGKYISLLEADKNKSKITSLVLSQSTIVNHEIEFLRRDETIGYGILNAVPVKDQDGNILNYICIVNDLTAKIKTEQELQEQREYLFTILNSLHDVVFVHDAATGEILDVNKAVEELYNYSPEEVKSKSIKDLSSGEIPYTQQEAYEWLKKTKDDGPQRFEWYAKRKNGTCFWAEITTTYAFIGGRERFIVLVHDITERKRIEEQLKQSRENYIKLFEDHSAVKLLIDPETGNIIDANYAAEKYYGWSREKLKRMKIQDINTLPAEKVKEEMQKAKELQKNYFEFKHRHADGSISDVEVFSSKVMFEGRELLHSIIHDSTERKKMEEEAKKIREQYERFFNEDLTGAFLSTIEGKLLTCNPAFVRIFGFSSKEEALATNVTELYISPEERQRILTILKDKRQLEYVEINMRKRDGSKLHIVANLIGHFDNNGKLYEIHGYLFDDTKRRLLEHQLRESQKFESLGTVASGIAHDFNNILGIILGHITLLRQGKLDPSKCSASLESISKAVERGANLVKQMLIFARKAESYFEPLNLNLIVKEMANMITETFPKTIELKTELEQDLPTIVGDSTQLHQVILNLCVNARDAMQKGGVLTITTKKVSAGQLEKQSKNITRDEYVELSVSDTGVGIDDAIRERIFEPFFTTKPKGQGTGLGLAVVYGIVANHSGFIKVDSSIGKGTTFRMYFPVAQKSLLEYVVDKKETIHDTPGGHETILLIEDEDALRELLAEMLETKGYTVLKAKNGYEGVEQYKAHIDIIDAVISDIGLPKLGGEEVFKCIREINPSAKVILASGYIDPNLKTLLLSKGVSEFILKPYRPEEVLKKLRMILDEKK